MSMLEDIHATVTTMANQQAVMATQQAVFGERQESQGRAIDELYVVVVKGNGRPGMVERMGILERIVQTLVPKAKSSTPPAALSSNKSPVIVAAKWTAGGSVLVGLIMLAVALV